MWDERCSADGYASGTELNDFLLRVIEKIARSRVLFLVQGEGKNAVFLAQQGYDVIAVDLSSVGLEKA